MNGKPRARSLRRTEDAVTSQDQPQLTDIPLLDLAGAPTSLRPLTTPLLVIQLVRYFGCLPCQQWLIDLDEATERLAPIGAQPLAVGGSADYQARWLREVKDVAMPLFLDPEQRLRDALHIGKLGVRLLDPRGARSYARALGQGLRPQGITRDTVQAPGVVILNEQRRVVWQHVGKRIGDYPPLQEVIEVVEELSSSDRQP